MPHRKFTDARPFLDLEAEVDRDEEEEEEEDPGELDGFIDDTEDAAHLDGQQNSHLQVWMRRWFGTSSGTGERQGGIDNEEEDGDELEVGEHSPNNGARSPVEERPPRTRDDAFESLRPDLPVEVSLQSILKPTDYPLWRVPCRQGIEQNTVLYLLDLAASPQYELRSAFTRGSIRGYVYLEATMNPSLIDLLKRTPGIRRESGRLQYDGIQQEDWEDLLKMCDSEAAPAVGEWVLISRGKYKGDLAYVSSFKDWQGVSVLLIPRIVYGDECPPSSKRKRAAYRPPPRLFDPDLVPKDARVQPVKLKEDVYKYGALTLENGLVRHSFDLHSISRGVLHIPTEVLAMFQESKHVETLAAQFPCPLEFKFEENELVLISPKNTPGRITRLHQCTAEVALLNGEGDVNVSWVNLRKHAVLGDYAEILNGVDQGRQGFVTTVQGSSVTLTELQRIWHHPTTRRTKEMTIHINRVKVIPHPPQSHLLEDPDHPLTDRPLQIDEVTRTFRTPWINKYVIVTKPKHPMKGSHAKVVDAIRPANPRSKPHLVVQFEHISPTGPQREQFSYDDVVDATSCRKLYAMFPKEHPFYFEMCKPPTSPSTRHREVATHDGSTPPWSPSSIDMSLSPAWNPSARSPFVPLSLSPAWNSSMSPSHAASGSETPNASTSTQPASATVSTVRVPPTHPLLDPRLVGKVLRVSVSGGTRPKNETPVSIVRGQNDEVVIQQSWRNQRYGLMPGWVKPRHPNPTRDNGLLVVIRGDHCGKYVRRIHHSYANGDRDQPVLLLAVVERADGAETITAEQVELPPEDLCQGFETDKEKNIGTKLMNTIREQARYPQSSR